MLCVPGGRLALSAFSAYFRLRYPGDERCTRSMPTPGSTTSAPWSQTRTATNEPVDLWTTCFTPRELRLLAAQVGLAVDHVWSVDPGDYGAALPTSITPSSCWWRTARATSRRLGRRVASWLG